MLIDSQCNFLPKKLRPMCKWKKMIPASKKQKPIKLGNYKTFRTCKQKCYGYGSIEGFFFFKKWKNLLQRKTSYKKGKGKGIVGRQTQANQIPKVYQEILPFKGG